MWYAGVSITQLNHILFYLLESNMKTYPDNKHHFFINNMFLTCCHVFFSFFLKMNKYYYYQRYNPFNNYQNRAIVFSLFKTSYFDNTSTLVECACPFTYCIIYRTECKLILFKDISNYSISICLTDLPLEFVEERVGEAMHHGIVAGLFCQHSCKLNKCLLERNFRFTQQV